jgi:hypothetical protein
MVGGAGTPRRFVVLVVLIAAVVGAALAMAVFALVRDARLRDSLERAKAETVFDLRLAGPLLEGSADLSRAVATFREERGVHAILVKGERTIDSDPGSTIAIPPDLRSIAGRGRIGYDRIDVGGVPTLLVGGPTPDRTAELYLAFSESRIHDDLRQLGVTLVVGWAAIVVIAFALARVAASRLAALAEAEAWGRRFTSDV